MRRALFGGIGLALGLYANAAVAQDTRPAPQPVRAARLGVPTAIPDTPEPVGRGSAPDDGVLPAGLRSRLAGIPVAGAPAPSYPTTGGFIYGAPIPGLVTGSPQTITPQAPSPGTSQPQPGGAPSVTETRTPGATGVPSIVSGGTYAVAPGLEAPIYCEAPGMAAVGRVGNASRWYLAGETLLWWTRSTTLPPLVTTSSPQFFGIPGLGDTRTIVGNDSFGDTFHTGGRLTIGRWLGCNECRGFEGRLFFLNESNDTFTTSTNAFPLLARPFFNVNTPVGPFSEVVGDPARGPGGISISQEHSLWGAEVNYRRFLCGNPCARIDGLIGYRYVGMKDELSITENFVSTGPNPILVGGVPVASGVVNDTFRTENHFHGGQVGLVGTLLRGRWSIEGRATVAFGNIEHQAEITGSQQLGLTNGMIATFPGGLLALPGANMGRYTQNQFCVVPEVGLNIGYQLTSRLRFFVGYNFLYIGNALRPEGLIDTNIDVARIPNFAAGAPAPLPGIPRPAPQFNLSDYFVQGISFGLSYRW